MAGADSERTSGPDALASYRTEAAYGFIIELAYPLIIEIASHPIIEVGTDVIRGPKVSFPQSWRPSWPCGPIWTCSLSP